jgi:hypothetical protein
VGASGFELLPFEGVVGEEEALEGLVVAFGFPGVELRDGVGDLGVAAGAEGDGVRAGPPAREVAAALEVPPAHQLHFYYHITMTVLSKVTRHDCHRLCDYGGPTLASLLYQRGELHEGGTWAIRRTIGSSWQ